MALSLLALGAVLTLGAWHWVRYEEPLRAMTVRGDSHAATTGTPVLIGSAGPTAAVARESSAPSTVALRGTVVDEWGKPVRGGTVAALEVRSWRPSTELGTADVVEGRFALQLPPAAAGRIKLTYSHAARGLVSVPRVVDGAARPSELIIVALRSARLSISALDSTGDPVVGARVDGMGRTGNDDVITDHRGTAELEFVPGGIGCTVEGAGGVFGKSPLLYLEAGSHQSVRVTCASRIQQVTLRLESVGPWPTADPLEHSWVTYAAGMPARTVEAAAGRQSIRCIPGSDVDLMIRLSTGATYEYSWPSLEEALSDGEIVVRVAPRTRVLLRVRNEREEALAGVALRLRPQAGEVGSKQQIAPIRVTLADGSVWIDDLHAGPCALEVRVGGSMQPDQLIDVPAGETTVDVHLRGWRAVSGPLVDGRLRLRESSQYLLLGDDYSGVVQLTPEASTWYSSVPPGIDRYRVRCTIPGVPEGDGSVGMPGPRLDLSGGGSESTFQVRLEGRQHVRGRLVLRRAGGPGQARAIGADIELETGKAYFYGLREGTYSATLVSGGMAPSTLAQLDHPLHVSTRTQEPQVLEFGAPEERPTDVR